MSFALSQGVTPEPNPPVWPNSVSILDPNTPEVSQKIVDQIFAVNGGHDPAWNGQFSSYRFALLFMPGVHNVTVNVGYYTSVIGLGQAPTDTNIYTVTCENGDFDYSGGALNNFWRSAENFYTKPVTYWNNESAPSMMWAVSQASPLRRVYIDGNLDLYEYNSGCCAGYASGGYLSDSVVTGTISSGSQQQWFTRNCDVGEWNGGNWNMVFLGNSGGIPATHCSNSNGWPITTTEETPIIAEKPYIVLAADGTYSISVPPEENNKVGATSNYQSGSSIDFSNVYVATSSDTSDTINQKLAEGKHLILTPGIYILTGTIEITQPGTVVLGMGLPTLISAAGNTVMEVSGVEGVRISGILFQAGSQPTENMLHWSAGTTDTSSNPGMLYDCFVRVGGDNDPSVQQVMVDTMVHIEQNDVIIDDAWLWRADHDITGSVYNSENPCNHGLVVDGDNVKTYGAAVEHTLQDLVQWNGENGEVYFFQSELPYDVTEAEFGQPGYVGFEVNPNVTTFLSTGMGVYSYFRDYNVTAVAGITAPNVSGVQFINPFTVFLNGLGEIQHVLNQEGDAVNSPAETAYLC